MQALLFLSAFLAASHAAPQFVFVLPQGFQQLMQDGTMPDITPFKLDELAPTAAEPSPAAEEVVASNTISEAGPALAANLATAADPMVESTPVEVASPVSEVVSTPEADLTPVADPMAEVVPAVEETSPVQEAQPEQQAEAVIIPADPMPTENEIVVDSIPAAADTTPVIAADATQAETVQVAEPVEVVAEAATVSETVVAAEPLSVAVESVPAVASSIPNKIIQAPAVNLIDPLAHVDPRFRSFIYANDSPDVVAAKVALFRIHASRVPTLKAPKTL